MFQKMTIANLLIDGQKNGQKSRTGLPLLCRGTATTRHRVLDIPCSRRETPAGNKRGSSDTRFWDIIRQGYIRDQFRFCMRVHKGPWYKRSRWVFFDSFIPPAATLPPCLPYTCHRDHGVAPSVVQNPVLSG